MTPAPPPPPPGAVRFEKRPEGMSDHDYLELWRARGPVAVDRHGILTTFSQAHLERVTDPRLTRQVELEIVAVRGLTSGPIFDFYANSMLFSNGARHAARRRPLARAFAFPLMEALRPRLRAVAEDLVRPCLGAGPVDFLDRVAGPLPARVMAMILGLGEAELPRFAARVQSSMRALALREGEDWAGAAADLGALNDQVTALLADRGARPAGDFLSDYVAAVADAELTEAEVRMQIVSVVLAGADTTRMALASTLSQLLQRPEQWAALVADPEGRKAAAAAEGLRFDPPVGALPRVAVAGFEIDGVTVSPGHVIAPSVIAALRDPAVHAAPDRFDLARADHPRWHPVFGAGAHRCLGEALARAELEEALAALARLAPRAELAGPPPRLSGLTGARAIDAMTVALA